MELPAAFVLATSAVEHEFNSARPDAPVVPFEERPHRVQQFRYLVAGGLRRAATVIAPSNTPAGPSRVGRQLHC
ncbi:hypothetical protein [Micromonospora sp. CA-111912]|uniref:hypothetical protein n=1 Tax=Micromonospora sp. CA-111912 TaxID=3239955 RepID=UPI003D94B405